MSTIRVTGFVDGFNFYHAIDDLRLHHLKWVNIHALCEHFAPRPQFDLTDVFYFSAYATWRPDPYKRHREYVKALKQAGVTPVMGRFKPKDRGCFKCGHQWQDHEEKETDVNIALRMMREGFADSYDRALLVSGDSDLVPAVKMVRSEFPEKQVKIITPLGRDHSMDLFRAAGGKKNCKKMKLFHVERSLFGRKVVDSTGIVIATRPEKYDPPGR
jgi:hypothetical protein